MLGIAEGAAVISALLDFSTWYRGRRIPETQVRALIRDELLRHRRAVDVALLEAMVADVYSRVTQTPGLLVESDHTIRVQRRLSQQRKKARGTVVAYIRLIQSLPAAQSVEEEDMARSPSTQPSASKPAPIPAVAEEEASIENPHDVLTPRSLAFPTLEEEGNRMSRSSPARAAVASTRNRLARIEEVENARRKRK